MSVHARGMHLAALNARLGRTAPDLQCIQLLVQHFLYSAAHIFLVLLAELSPICSSSSAKQMCVRTDTLLQF